MTAQIQVVALFIHGDRPSRPEDDAPTPMLAMPEFDVIEGRGVRQDRRYCRPADPGRVRKRQLSVIDEGTIRRHEERFGPIGLALVKAQIVLSGDLFLPDLVGHTLIFADGAHVEISVARVPCFAMDFIYPGLKDAMEQGSQGAMAMVIRGGHLTRGQQVQVT